MSNSFMPPLSTFTLESLVAEGRWTAAQASRKRPVEKPVKPKRSEPNPATASEQEPHNP